jgi:hypothetical protein
VWTRFGQDPGSGVGQAASHRRGINDPQGDPDMPGYTAADLDLVDKGGLRRIGDLQSGFAGFQDDDAPIG